MEMNGYWSHQVESAQANPSQASEELQEFSTQIGTSKMSALKSETSRSVFIALDGLDDNVIACVEKGKSHINYNADHLIAANNNEVRHATSHEEEHFKRPWDLKFEENGFARDKAAVLAAELGLDIEEVLDPVFWIEGAVEHQTILKHGRDEKIAYLDEEVPAHTALCQLVYEHLKIDFHSHFKKGNEEAIVELFVELADILMAKQVFKAA